ncbi:MAG: hypothetical protein M1459_00115 [Patescibacteria group bacterium]|nr:hypothetical protein [Patescibacteria group bacterium]
MSHEEYLTIKNEPEHLALRNKLQIELAVILYVDKDLAREKMLNEWIPKYSKRFREIFDKTIRANPHLLRDIEDPATHDTIVKGLSDELYETSRLDLEA